MEQLTFNKLVGRLAGSLALDSTVLKIHPDIQSKDWPTALTDQYFYVTIFDTLTSEYEIVKVTAMHNTQYASMRTYTVVRNIETSKGFVPKVWDTGTKVSQLIVAQTITDAIATVAPVNDRLTAHIENISTTAIAGHVALDDTVTSEEITKASTPRAVKEAYDKAVESGAAASAAFTRAVQAEEVGTRAATTTVAGSVKLDALAKDGTTTCAPGGYGLGTEAPVILDCNAALPCGYYFATPDTVNTPIPGGYYSIEIVGVHGGMLFNVQIARDVVTGTSWTRLCRDTVRTPWVRTTGGCQDLLGSAEVEANSTLDISSDGPDVMYITCTGNTTFNLLRKAPDYRQIKLLRIVYGGNYAITWPPIVHWPGGKAPTLSVNGVDEVLLLWHAHDYIVATITKGV